MVVQYAGTADFASTSDSLGQTIGTPMITTTVHASWYSSSLSQSVVFTFNVAAGVGTPFDPMASLDEDDMLRTVMLDPKGQVGLSTSLFNVARDADSKARATGSPAPELVDALLAAILTDSDSWEGFDLPTAVWAKDQEAGSAPVSSCPLDGS